MLFRDRFQYKQIDLTSSNLRQIILGSFVLDEILAKIPILINHVLSLNYSN